MTDPATSQSDLRIMWRLARYGLRYPAWCALLLGATAAVAAASGYLVVVTRQVLDVVKEVDTGQSGALAHMRWLGIEALILAPFVAVAFYAAWVAGQFLANRCMLDLRGEFLARLVDLDLAFHHSLTRGDLITRMTSDADSIQSLFQYLFGKAFQRPAEVLGTVGFLFYIDWRFASVLFLVFAPAGMLLSRLLRRTTRKSKKARQRLAEHVMALEQITAGIRVIKTMGSGARERQRYANTNARLFNANMQMARSRGQTDAISGSLTFVLIAAVALGGAVALGHGWSTGTTLLTFLTALGRVTTQMRSGTKSYGEIQENLPAATRLFAVIDRTSAIVDRPDATVCDVPRDAIVFEGVHFRHNEESEILRGVDLKIPVGSVVALVGESGAGKSTILDLLLRFHDVTAGRILVDGADIRSMTHASLIGHVATVSQDSFLFNDTVYNNILYGRPDASRDEVEAAARRAHLHEAVLALDAGYETVVGDRGERLSGGQRQRVAIARALLRNAPVLLLDEPTSALDAESERHVRDALSELMKGRTCLIVAHRLTTIQHADIIYVLDRATGAISQTGTHGELLAQEGEYARLVRMQQLQAS